MTKVTPMTTIKNTNAMYSCPCSISDGSMVISNCVDLRFTCTEEKEILTVCVNGVMVGIDYEFISQLVAETRRGVRGKNGRVHQRA